MVFDPTKTGAWANLEERSLEIRATIPPTAAGSDAFFLVGTARFAGSVTEVGYYPNAGITGAATNNRRLRAYNRKADGTGTQVVASVQFDATVNSTSKVKKVLTLDATAAHLVVAEGDVFEFASDHIGTGLADAGGLLIIKVSPSN